MSDQPILLDVKKMSSLLDMTPRNLQILAGKKIITAPEQRGRYSLEGCVTPYIVYLKGGGTLQAGSDDDVDVNTARARNLNVQTRMKEIEIREKEGELVEFHQVQELFVAMMNDIKISLQGSLGRENQSAIDDALNDLSTRFETYKASQSNTG
ncbi:MAG: hypothetical protein AAF512_02555 [Pseudomonadota bacterium]